jgi:hypothetical protein
MPNRMNQLLTRLEGSAYIWGSQARIAQLVEHNLAKVGVAGSSPVSRSSKPPVLYRGLFFWNKAAGSRSPAQSHRITVTSAKPPAPSHWIKAAGSRSPALSHRHQAAVSKPPEHGHRIKVTGSRSQSRRNKVTGTKPPDQFNQQTTIKPWLLNGLV